MSDVENGNGNGNGECEDCCKIPVCLEFICASATEEFKEKMKEIFSEIFSDICNGDNEDNGDEESAPVEEPVI